MSLLRTLLSPIQFIVDLFLPDPPSIDQQTGTQVTKDATDAFIPVLFGGPGKVKGIVTFQNVQDDTTGDDIENDLLLQLIIFSEGPIQEFGAVYVDDELSTSDRFDASDADNGEDGDRWFFDVPFLRGMRGYRYNILENAGYNPFTHKYTDLSVIFARSEWESSGTAFQRKPDISVNVVRGFSIRNPQNDQVSGQFDNPVMVLYELLTNTVFGRSLTDDDFDRQSLIDSWPKCASLVPRYNDTTSTRRRYTCNWRMETNTDWAERVDVVLAIIRGHLPRVDGRYKLIIEEDTPPIEYELIIGENFYNDYKIFEAEKYTQVIGEFKDEDNDFAAQDVIFPPKGSELYEKFLARNFGIENPHRPKLTGTTNRSEGLIRCKQIAYNSQFGIMLSIPNAVPRSALHIDCGTLVKITIPEEGFEKRVFRCTKKTISGTSPSVSYEFVLHQQELHELEFIDEPTITPLLPSPSISLLAPTNVNALDVYDDNAQVMFSWNSDSTTFEYRIIDVFSQTVLLVGNLLTTTLSINNYPVGNYRFDVRARNNLGSASSDWVFIEFQIIVPATPTSSPEVTSRPGLITVVPQTPNATSHFYEFEYFDEIDMLPVPGGDNNTLVITNVKPDVTYTIRYRLVSPLGMGEFVEVMVNGVEQLFYTWIVYADDNVGTGISIEDDTKPFYGIATNRLEPLTPTTNITDIGLFDFYPNSSSGGPGVTAELSNSNHTISTDSAGENGNLSGAQSTITVRTGQADDTDAWTLGTSASSGITGTFIGRTFTVTSMNVDQGTVTFLATREGFAPFTLVFTVSKVKAGTNGRDGLNGVDGVDGQPGDNGLPGRSVAQLRIFRRLNSIPTAPTGGSFNFSTNTLTPPTGWSLAPPAPSGTSLLYESSGIAAINGTTGVDNAIPWSNAGLVAVNGRDGNDGRDGEDGRDGSNGSNGRSVFQKPIFRRANSAPVRPTGGTYNFGTNAHTAPSGWNNAVPTGSAPIYVSEATYTIVGTTGAVSNPTWTSPQLLARNGEDGSNGSNGSNGSDGTSTYLYQVFRRAGSVPARPTGGSFNFGSNTGAPPSGWSNSVPSGTAPIYTTQALASVSGSTGTDSSLSWVNPQLLARSGVNGLNGLDGDNGKSTYLYQVFRRANSAPARPSGGSFNFSSNVGTPPSGWNNEIPSGTSPIYASQALASVTGNLGLAASLDWSNTMLVARNGEPGQNGDTGSRGPEGPIGPRGPQGPQGPTATLDSFVDADTTSTLSTSWRTVASVTVPPNTYAVDIQMSASASLITGGLLGETQSVTIEIRYLNNGQQFRFDTDTGFFPRVSFAAVGNVNYTSSTTIVCQVRVLNSGATGSASASISVNERA